MLLTICLFGITNCKKDSKNPDKATVIVGKHWKLTAYTEDGVDKLHSTYEACELDNTHTYFSGGKLTMDEGAIKCSGSPQTEEFKWAIDGDKLTISQDGFALQLAATILDLSDNTLKFSYKNPFGTEIVVETYSPQ